MNEEELRRRFSELRREDARQAPPFDARTRPRARPRVVQLIAPALAAAALVLLWFGRRPEARAPAPTVAVAPLPPSSALAPTRVAGRVAALPLDFLLEAAPARVRLDADPIEGLRR